MAQAGMNSGTIRLLSLFYCAVSTVAIGLIVYFDLGAGVALPSSVEDALVQLGVGGAVGGAVVWFSRFAAKTWKAVADLEAGFRDLIGPLSGRDIFLAAFASSVGEELFFRAALQPLLGIWIASAIFALLHWGPTKAFSAWPVLALGAGFLFGGLFEYFGMVWASITAHFVINYVNLGYLSKGKLGSIP